MSSSHPRTITVRSLVRLFLYVGLLVCMVVQVSASSDWPTILKTYDITTPQAKPNGTEAWTVSALSAIKSIPQFVYYNDTSFTLNGPTTGAATSSVHRTRCEAKGEPFYLATNAYLDISITATLERVNYAKKVVVLQMHCDDGNDPTFKGFWDNGNIVAGIRTEAGSADPKNQLVLSNVQLGDEFTFGYRYVNATRNFTVYASSKGRNGAVSSILTPVRAARPSVLHFGVYNQIDMGAAEEPVGDASRISVHSLIVYGGVIPSTSSSSSSTGGTLQSSSSSSGVIVQSSSSTSVNVESSSSSTDVSSSSASASSTSTNTLSSSSSSTSISGSSSSSSSSSGILSSSSSSGLSSSSSGNDVPISLSSSSTANTDGSSSGVVSAAQAYGSSLIGAVAVLFVALLVPQV